MFALEVEYLTGTAVATDRVDRRSVEWPPHPQRLFSALVAAWAECDLGEEVRGALEWLEKLPPPELRFAEGFTRDVHPVYVPVNDSAVPDSVPRNGFFARQLASGRQVLPEHRSRQERFFPSIALDDRTVHFVWRESEGVEEHRSALQRVVSEVVYLGHSSSLVRVCVKDSDMVDTTWRPARTGQRRSGSLRTPNKGRLRTLVETHDLSRDVGRRIEPPDGLFVDYASTASASTGMPSSIFGGPGDWFVFAPTSGRSLPLSKALQLTHTVRRALVRLADDAGALPNELLTGHREDGKPTETPHASILPLPFVGHRYATGEIKGFAVVLPHDHAPGGRRRMLAALSRLQRIFDGLDFEWTVSRETNVRAGIRTLDPREWIGTRRRGTSRYWATVTPVIFGHHPGRRFDSPKTVRVISECCRQIGLPEPRVVYVSKVSKHRGVPPASDFDTLTFTGKPSWIDRSGPPRLRAHVALEFDRPVAGPVILGAGRYYGMGLCKPWFPPRSREGE